MPLRVLIVDDHRMAREAIRTALLFCRRAEPVVVGEAADGATALELVDRLRPNLVTVDIGLPDADGLEVVRRLVAGWPGLWVVVVTVHKAPELQEAAARAGAVSLITKERLVAELPVCLDRLVERAPHRTGP